MTLKKAVGYLMIISVFVALFAGMYIQIGIMAVLKTIAVEAVIVLFIGVGVYLATDKKDQPSNLKD